MVHPTPCSPTPQGRPWALGWGGIGCCTRRTPHNPARRPPSSYRVHARSHPCSQRQPLPAVVWAPWQTHAGQRRPGAAVSTAGGLSGHPGQEGRLVPRTMLGVGEQRATSCGATVPQACQVSPGPAVLTRNFLASRSSSPHSFWLSSMRAPSDTFFRGLGRGGTEWPPGNPGRGREMTGQPLTPHR